MNRTKEKRAKWMAIISSLILTILLITELFLMITNGVGYLIAIIILGVVALAAVYLLVSAIMTLEAEKEKRREEHYENIYKAEKASYIMLKNKFKEIDAKLALLQENSRIPSEEIINAQKGIAKVIINRSKENADAIINSNDQVLERLDEIDETQNTKFTGISKDQRLKLTEMSNQTEIKLQDMIVQLKDMELRLNQTIMQIGGKTPLMDVPEDVFLQPQTIEENEEDLIRVFDDSSLEVEEFVLDATEEEVFETMEEDINPDELLAEEVIKEPVVEEPMAEEPIVEEVAEVKPPMPDLSDPNRALSPEEIAALIANL